MGFLTDSFYRYRSSTEDEEEENGSLCSCSVPRDGDAFPKAFERELVTPTHLATASDKQVLIPKIVYLLVFFYIFTKNLND